MGAQQRFDRRLEEVAKAVGGGYCRLQMPLRLALGVRETVAGHRLGALEGGGVPPPLPMHPWRRPIRGPCGRGSRGPAVPATRQMALPLAARDGVGHAPGHEGIFILQLSPGQTSDTYKTATTPTTKSGAPK